MAMTAMVRVRVGVAMRIMAVRPRGVMDALHPPGRAPRFRWPNAADSTCASCAQAATGRNPAGRIERGGNLGQGYLFSRPIPAQEAGRLIKRRTPSARAARATPDRLALAAGQAQEEQEQVDEVQVELEGADHGRLLHRAGL